MKGWTFGAAAMSAVFGLAGAAYGASASAAKTAAQAPSTPAAAAAAPADAIGIGRDGALGLQPAATPVMQHIHQFHDLLLWIITAISLFVLALLIWVMVRYNRAANPTPKAFTHNLTIEVLWTIIPVFILVAIAGFSFPLLFQEERQPPQVSFTIKAIGNTWVWNYVYPEYGVELTSNMLTEADAKAKGEPYRLGVDEPIYVPVGENVRVQMTSNDVIHSWTVPSFGVKQDAIPGRINQGWFKVLQPGTYYGQCSELCGKGHAFMPIEVKAVSRPEFERWIIAKGGKLPAAPAQGAAAADARKAG